MSHTFESFNSTTTDDLSEHGVVAKLRRLKIEESLCLKNIINKITFKENDDDADLPVFYTSELKHFSTTIRKAFSEINNLFDDIKAETEEKLSGLDIGNMKKDVMKLDDKIRTFKNYLQSELASVVSKEEGLNILVNKVEEKKLTSNFKSKIKMKPFNNIVPSPVKVLIKSPFKCKEVQEFQEFMMCSPNRYGGWNEYHHNIFVQVWQKYFTADIEVGDSVTDEFQSEILQKVAGSTVDEIIRHQEWYSKYLCLKEQQQNALNKWRNSKRRPGKTQFKYQGDQKRCYDKTKWFHSNDTNNAENELPIIEGFSDLNTIKINEAREITSALCGMSFENNDLAFHGQMDMSSEVTSATDHSSGNTEDKQRKRSFNDILKPTKQWFSRCNSSRDSVNEMYNIECVTKLRIPDWRLSLQN